MRIIDIGKEHVDIEIGSKAYRLPGELYKDGFMAIVSQITMISSSTLPMGMAERTQTASVCDASVNKDFVDWLKNPNTKISTNLICISDDEKEMVVRTVTQKAALHELSLQFIRERNGGQFEI